MLLWYQYYLDKLSFLGKVAASWANDFFGLTSRVEVFATVSLLGISS